MKFGPVRVPGDQAAKSLAEAAEVGIEYDETVWASIRPWAEKLRVAVP